MRLFFSIFLGSIFCAVNATSLSSPIWQENVAGISMSAFNVGYDRQRNVQLYVCRTRLWGGRQLGSTWRKHGRCYVPYAKKTYVVDNYSVLSRIEGRWQPFYGFFPKSALLIGVGVKKVPLALCRGYHHSSLIPGKTWRGHNTCDIVYHGKALSLPRYSIFIRA